MKTPLPLFAVKLQANLCNNEYLEKKSYQMKAMNSDVDFVVDLDLMWMLLHQYPPSTSTILSDFGIIKF